MAGFNGKYGKQNGYLGNQTSDSQGSQFFYALKTGDGMKNCIKKRNLKEGSNHYFNFICLKGEAEKRGYETISDMLYIMYEEEYCSPEQIANLFCLSRECIVNYLKNLGFKVVRRPVYRKELFDEITKKIKNKEFGSWIEAARFIQEERWYLCNTNVVDTVAKEANRLQGTYRKMFKSKKEFDRKVGKPFTMGGKFKFSVQERRRIYDEYMKSDLTQKQLAEKWGCSTFCIFRILKDVKGRKRG